MIEATLSDTAPMPSCPAPPRPAADLRIVAA
jgi:hypothetical protein